MENLFTILFVISWLVFLTGISFAYVQWYLVWALKKRCGIDYKFTKEDKAIRVVSIIAMVIGLAASVILVIQIL